MRKTSKTTKKYLLLASVLMLMMLLCACRTRLTNNTEVSQSVTDEDGMLTAEYDMRREELGMPVAEKPIFTGWGSAEDDIDYTDGNYSFDTYDPGTDTWEDPPESDPGTSTSTDTSTGTGTTTTRPGSTTTRRPSTNTGSNTSSNTKKIKITLDLNDGEGTKNTLTVKKDTPYKDFLPEEALREGYTFTKWTTDKAGKKAVDLKAKATKDQTLYAQWKKAEKKQYTISFDGNGGSDQVTVDPASTIVEEGGTYGSLATAKRAGYKFDGWYTEKEGGKKVDSGDKFSAGENQTLYAHWTEDWYNYFNEEQFKPAANQQEANVDVYIYNDSTSGKQALVEDSKGKNVTKPDEGEFKPAYVIIFGNPADQATKDKAQAAYEEFRQANPSVIVLIIPTDSTEGNDNQKLYYRMLLLNQLHPGSISQEQLDLVYQKLGLDGSSPIVVYPETTPDPAPGS